MREKLFKIIDNNLCMENNWVTKESIYKAADAIIESGLLKDDKVYEAIEQEITIPQVVCPSCGYFVGLSLDIISYSYCPGCGVKLKSNRRNHNASSS